MKDGNLNQVKQKRSLYLDHYCETTEHQRQRADLKNNHRKQFTHKEIKIRLIADFSISTINAKKTRIMSSMC